MIFDKGTSLGGFWHCPFTKEWVMRMRHAAKHCERLSTEYIERMLNHEWMTFTLPPGDFLSEEQDARGLPLSWCRKEEERYNRYPIGCTAVYDYDSIPEMVITNGYDDWPLEKSGKVLHA